MQKLTPACTLSYEKTKYIAFDRGAGKVDHATDLRRCSDPKRYFSSTRKYTTGQKKKYQIE